MTPRRLYLALVILIVVLISGLGGGIYEANQLFTSKANGVTSLKTKITALQQEKLEIAQAKKQIAANQPLEKIAQTVVPQDKDQAETVREIVNLAAANNIQLASITFPASNLGQGPSGSSSTSSAVPSSSNKSVSLSQLQQVKNIPGVYVLQISVQSNTLDPVSYPQFISFLQGLENNRRTAEVSTIAIQPTTAKSGLLSLTFNLTLNEYIRP